jgi:CRP/FNR family transcriptional regulator, cyclic AMP receptor protein
MGQNISKILQDFYRHYPIRIYKKGETIIRFGDPFVKIFFIKSGIVRAYSLTKNGRELSLLLYAPGSYFPTIVALSFKDSDFYFVAKTDVEVYTAPTEKFKEFVINSPLVLYDMAARGGTMVQQLLKRYEIFITEKPYVRIVTILLFLYKFYHLLGNKFICEGITVCHQELATWIHTSRETVSRQIEILEHKGIVKCSKNKLVIRSIARLKAEI